MNISKYLLPGGFKLAGFLFLPFGILLGAMRFKFGIKPDFLNLKPFAVFSSYLENKFMQFVPNNFIEEIIGILVVLGLFFIAFSKDKNETEAKGTVRIKVLFTTMYIHLAFLLLSMLFTFGLAFVYMLMVNIALPLTVYIVLFRVLLLTEHINAKKHGHRNN